MSDTPYERKDLFRLKKSRPYGLPHTPFNPETGTHLGFTDPPYLHRAKFVSEDENTLMVKIYQGSGNLGPEVECSKLIGLRRQDYDGLTYDDATYAYVTNSQRTAEDADENSFTQNIVPSYSEDLDLLVVRVVGGAGVTDKPGVEWLDVTPGRWWLEDA